MGFRYATILAIAQFAHPAVITVLTPAGRVSRYLFGIDYGATDLRLALLDASGNKIGSVVDATLLYCYHYDPATGRYSLAIMSLIRIGGLITVAGLGASIVLTVRRQRRQARAVAHTASGAPLDVEQPFPVSARPRPRSRPRWTCSTRSWWRCPPSSRCSSSSCLAFFTIKYRRRHPDDVGADIHGSLVLEIVWTFIPFVLSMIMFAWGASLFYRLSRPPAGAMEVTVVGKQWMWKIEHEEGVREINELHVPLGRDVRVSIGSEDVIHDFAIPAFRVRMPDARCRASSRRCGSGRRRRANSAFTATSTAARATRR